jgi:hypothetical protein
MKPVDIGAGLRLIITKMETASIDYMIVGSIAGTVYGEPRLTRDIDLVVALSGGAIDRMAQAFEGLDFYVPPMEILSQEATRGGHANILHQPSGVKLDLIFRKSTAHALEEFSRRRRIEILQGLEAWVAAPEDVIISKLRFYREGESAKHLTDIRGILANTNIDRNYLDRWIEALELQSCFAKI